MSVIISNNIEQAQSEKKRSEETRVPLTNIPLAPLKLETKPYTITVPDLRDEILFYGRNLRPDVKEGKILFFIGLEGREELVTIEESSPLYLQYHSLLQEGQQDFSTAPLWGDPQDDSSQEGKGSYYFSPNNRPTALWIELKNIKQENQVQVHLFLKDENGNEILGNEEFLSFRLHAKTPKASTQWELDKYRVDPTLLVRQKGRFTGEDLFLKMHGGSEYASVENHSRIDFLGTEPTYSCFVQEGDFLIWENGRWNVVDNRMTTTNKPLLIVKKIDERMIYLELWNELGSQKIALSLVRLRDHHSFPNIAVDFHFVQAKTWSQFIVECRGKKMTLRPNDWLLLTEEGWQLIDTVEKIDDYVSQTIQGPLFVVGKLKKEGAGQVLTGHLFNTTRSEVIDVTLALKHSPSHKQELSLIERGTLQQEAYYED
jgi:hypothetical protein